MLIAGVGNIFLRDDAFGVEVAQRLLRRPLPEGVRVVDFGIRGYDLTTALLGGYEAVILVDSAPRGGRPGTLYVIEPELDDRDGRSAENLAFDPHNLDPVRVLHLAAALGSPVRRVLLVGCEPAPLDADEMQAGLSDSVAAAVNEAVGIVESLAAILLAEGLTPCMNSRSL